MGTLKINGYLSSPSIWGTGGNEENHNGINFKSGSLYLYGKTASDTRGIYDSLVGSVISVTNSGTHFYGNASSASNSDAVDGYHASSLTKDFYLEHSIFNDLTNNGYGGVTYCGGATDGYLCIGREWGWSNGNNFGMQLEVSGWDGTLRTRSFNGWGTGWTSWKTYIHDGNIGSQSVNYASSAGNSDTVDGWHADGFLQKHGWWYSGESYSVNNLTSGIVFAYTNHGAPASWGHTIAFTSGGDNAYVFQLHATGTNRLFMRNKSLEYGWKDWTELLTESNYSQWCLPLSGGTMTGRLKIQTNGITLDIGAQNQSWVHIYNGAVPFIFDQPIWTMGCFGIYQCNSQGCGSSFPSNPSLGQIFFKI